MLGTNDSKMDNWKYGSEYLSNYEEMIDHYRNLPSHPRVYLNTSPTTYAYYTTDINQDRVHNEIIPKVWQAGFDKGCTVIDIHTATSGMPQNFPDLVHPNQAGANVITNTIYAGLMGSTPQPYGSDICTGGTTYASTENPPNETASKAFDNQIIWSKWMSPVSSGWIDYDFDGSSAYAVNSYTITSADDMQERDPKNWTLKGSNDGIYWKVLDTRSNENFSSRNQTRIFNFSNSNTYTVYRLDINDNHGGSQLQLAELQMFEDYTPPTSSTDRCYEGTITASSENLPIEGKDKAFDDNSATKWLCIPSTGWIQYDFIGIGSYAINSYTITSANDVPGRDPKSWTLQGSNDGINWTVVDTRINETFNSRFQKRTFSFSNMTAYQIYKLNITENNGEGNLQLAEIEMFEN
jgi:hypothetical protein